MEDTVITREDAKSCIEAIEEDMATLVDHREELAVIAKFDKNLAAKMVGVFDAADEVLDYIADRDQ